MRKSSCGNCHTLFDRNELIWVKDRYGIPYKLVCDNCYEKVEAEISKWVFDELYAAERLESDY
jgi:predicted 3-demethylubiquinone-9 3-methyltransferase (glyoxalase superfamily)